MYKKIQLFDYYNMILCRLEALSSPHAENSCLNAYCGILNYSYQKVLQIPESYLEQAFLQKVIFSTTFRC